MAFKAKNKERKLEPDCIDFKPCLLDKKHCKLSHKCDNAGGKYRVDTWADHSDLCTGVSQIRYDEWLKNKYIPIMRDPIRKR